MYSILSAIRGLFARKTEQTRQTEDCQTGLELPHFTERRLLQQFEKRPTEMVDELIQFVRASPVYSLNQYEPTWSGDCYRSCSGLITVCMDTFGPEVIILPRKGLLDILPEEYGLTEENALRLYAAILSRVPGSSNFNFDAGKL